MSLIRTHAGLIGAGALVLLGLALLGGAAILAIRSQGTDVRIARGRLAQARMERRAAAERERAAAARRRDIQAALQSVSWKWGNRMDGIDDFLDAMRLNSGKRDNRQDGVAGLLETVIEYAKRQRGGRAS